MLTKYRGMSMRKYLFLISLVIALFVGILLIHGNKSQPTQKERLAELPTEQFIQEYLINEEGIVRTNFLEEDQEEQYLSESMGIWLEYLELTKDHKQFNQAVEAIQTHFLLNNDLVAWEIVDGQTATTNALIDDLRMIEMLFKEGERRKEPRLIKFACKRCLQSNDHNASK